MKLLNPILDKKFKWLLLLLDLVAFMAITAVVAHFRLRNESMVLFNFHFLSLSLLIILNIYVFGGYDINQRVDPRTFTFRQVGALGFSIISVIVVNYLFFLDRSGIFGRGILLGSVILFFVASYVYRSLFYYLMDVVRSRLTWLILIKQEDRLFFEGDLARLGFKGTIQYLDPTKESVSNLNAQLSRLWSSVVVGVRSDQVNSEILELLMKAKFSGQAVIDLSRFYEKHWLKVPVYFLDPEWFIASEGFEAISHPIAKKIKRLADILFSLIIFVLAFPFMILTALAVRLESAGPVIYSQTRTGKNGYLFSIYKFRSMRVDAEKEGAKWAQKNDSRVTRVGAFIRKTRLDELPQLWNVLKGEMSFVGPRPERPEFNEMLAQEIPFYNLRHILQPGLTGWAQILYPYGASVEDAREKLQYDLFYAKHYNLMMDVVIFIKTVQVVLFGRGR